MEDLRCYVSIYSKRLVALIYSSVAVRMLALDTSDS